MLIGALVLVGWVFDLHELKSAYGDNTMKPNAAVSLILTDAGLIFLTIDRKPLRLLGQICAASAILIALLTLSEHVFGWNLHIDELLFIEPPGAIATIGEKPFPSVAHASASQRTCTIWNRQRDSNARIYPLEGIRS
jgi:hypothetical protein